MRIAVNMLALLQPASDQRRSATRGSVGIFHTIGTPPIASLRNSRQGVKFCHVERHCRTIVYHGEYGVCGSWRPTLKILVCT